MSLPTITTEQAMPSTEIAPVKEQAFGGGLEGAQRTSRETVQWVPTLRSPDNLINPLKEMADARGRDTVQNDGYAQGGVAVHRDSIVGSCYRLNAQPDIRVIGADQGWADEFQQTVEARFNLIAESEACWLDAAGMNTLTGLVRLAVGGFVMTGEVVATSEWLRAANRPVSTAFQMISPDRLCNPDGTMDTRYLRRGIEKDIRGKPLAYWFRQGYPYEGYADLLQYKWVRVPAEKPWGRKQVIHIIEQLLPDQSRGVADMVAALKQMRMTKNFQEVTLQSAVVAASYFASIESELPPAEVMAAMGAGQPVPDNLANSPWGQALGWYMGCLQSYYGNGKNVTIDGAKIPVFMPGTKLNMQPAGTPGGVGSAFETSLLRHIAAALGLSYEELSRDYSQVSYSSARASMLTTRRFMAARKKSVADRFASIIYTNVLEEEIANGNVPLPPGKKRDHFYEPLMREAYSKCSWIGASSGQIDELKETQAAILRIKSGLSTYEAEIAKLGGDFREVFEQRAREEGIIKAKGLAFSLDAQRQGRNMTTQNLAGQNASDNGDQQQ
jgi:lambda family phage portal protein